MPSVRERFIDSLWCTPVPKSIIVLAACIVDTLELQNCSKSCAVSLFIAWKVHGDGFEYSAKRFIAEVIPFIRYCEMTEGDIFQKELLLMQKLNWTVPLPTFWDMLPQVSPVFVQFIDQAVLHVLQTQTPLKNAGCLAWATVYYACYLSAYQLDCRMLTINVSTTPDAVRSCLQDLFKKRRIRCTV